MELTGHRTREVFERYNITSQADRRAAVEKLAAHLAVPAKQAKRPSKKTPKKGSKGTTAGQSRLRAVGGKR
jgi:hypothetical protein